MPESATVAPGPSVVPILATPFGVLPLPGAAELNPGLLDLFRGVAASEPGVRRTPLVYQSTDDLLERPDPRIVAFKTLVYQGLQAFLAAINDFAPGQLESFAPESRAAFAIIRQNGSVLSHNYSLAAWCCVYCVAAPDSAGDRVDSGVLRLHEFRLGTAFSDASNAQMRMPYLTGHYNWRPVPGSLAVFPAHLVHEIATLRSPGELVLATMRVRFRAPGQTGMGRW